MNPNDVLLSLIARLEAERLAAVHRAERAEEALRRAQAEIARLTPEPAPTEEP